jgi:diaminopimelate epimerase
MKLSKYHGAGNDLILIEDMEDRLRVTPPLVVALCDRHRGVGADGVIRIAPGMRTTYAMEYWNADGSWEAMCGNGALSVATHLYDRGRIDRTKFELETGDGLKRVALDVLGGSVVRAQVELGPVRLRRAEIPMKGPPGDRLVGVPWTVEGMRYRATAVSVGNPHLVLLGEADLGAVDLRRVGPSLEHHPDFPDRVNVEFIRVLDGDIQARVWERGVGETAACGTGACASLVAAHLLGETPRRAKVRFAGGDLEVEWTEDDRLLLTGSATFVFEADLDHPRGRAASSWTGLVITLGPPQPAARSGATQLRGEGPGPVADRVPVATVGLDGPARPHEQAVQ